MNFTTIVADQLNSERQADLSTLKVGDTIKATSGTGAFADCFDLVTHKVIKINAKSVKTEGGKMIKKTQIREIL